MHGYILSTKDAHLAEIWRRSCFAWRLVIGAWNADLEGREVEASTNPTFEALPKFIIIYTTRLQAGIVECTSYNRVFLKRDDKIARLCWIKRRLVRNSALLSFSLQSQIHRCNLLIARVLNFYLFLTNFPIFLHFSPMHLTAQQALAALSFKWTKRTSSLPALKKELNNTIHL